MGAGKCREFPGSYAQKYGLWIGAATQSGYTIHEDFPGGGGLFAPTGERVYATPDWSSGAVCLALDLETGQVQDLSA